jgi:hypothetical protein
MKQQPGTAFRRVLSTPPAPRGQAREELGVIFGLIVDGVAHEQWEKRRR